MYLFELMQDTEHGGKEAVEKLKAWCTKNKYEYTCIKHDKDKDDEGNQKREHYHMLIKTGHKENGKRYGTNYEIKDIAKIADVEPQYIMRVKSEEARKRYMVHHDDPEKYQYNIQEVQATYSYAEWLEASDKRHEKANKKKEKETKWEEIEAKINAGVIKEYNWTQHISIQEYVQYKHKIQIALEYKLEELKKSIDRNMNVIYCYGQGGVGKDLWCKETLYRQGLPFGASHQGKDVFAGYRGEPAFLWSDFRSWERSYADLLKILDNNSAYEVGARYKDKLMVALETMYITSNEKWWVSKEEFEKLKTYWNANCTSNRQEDERLLECMKQDFGHYVYMEKVLREMTWEDLKPLRRRVKTIYDWNHHKNEAGQWVLACYQYQEWQDEYELLAYAVVPEIQEPQEQKLEVSLLKVLTDSTYFGDNREASADSRENGGVRRGDIEFEKIVKLGEENPAKRRRLIGENASKIKLKRTGSIKEVQ